MGRRSVKGRWCGLHGNGLGGVSPMPTGPEQACFAQTRAEIAFFSGSLQVKPGMAESCRFRERGFPGARPIHAHGVVRSEEHTSELQSLRHLVCRLLLEKKKHNIQLHPLDHQDFIAALTEHANSAEPTD